MRHHVAAAGVLLAVVLVWFHPLLGGDRLGQAHALYVNVPWASEAPRGIADAARSGEGDAALEYEPVAAVARTSVRNGHLPLLNPTIYAGAPLLGDMQAALAFPLTWLMVPLGVSAAAGWVALLRLLIAGLGAYALARRLGAGWGGAMLAGLAYMLCAPLVVWAQWPLATEFALFAWLLWATDGVQERLTAGRVAALGAVVGLSVLGGHPETALWSSVFAGLYLLVRVVGERRPPTRPVAAFVGAHVLGLLAGGVALVPFLQAYAESITRSVHDLFARAHLPLDAGVTYLLPEAFGAGKPAYTGPYLTYQLAAGYVGILVLLLAGVTVVRRAREPLMWALGAIAALALAVVFAIPPVSWIVRAVPPFSEGNNLRLLYAVALVVAVGAGLGLDGLLRRPLRRDRLALGAGIAVTAAGSYVLVVELAGNRTAGGSTEVRALASFAVMFVLAVGVVWAAGRLRRGGVVAAALLLAVLELAYLADWNVFLPPDQATPPQPGSVAFLRSRPPPFRLSGLWTSLGPPESLPAATAGYYGLESVQGYDFPLSERWANLSFFVLGERGLARELPTKTSPVPRGRALRALRMLNVRYYLAPPAFPPPSSVLRRAYAGRDATVFADPGALPRAWVVARAAPTSDGAALTALRRGALDPRRTAFVPPGVPPVASGGHYAPARARELDAQHWRVALPPGRGGWLVFGASWSPLWDATVDGRDVDTHPTDYALVGLPVPAGAHTVHFRYAGTAAAWGLALSIAGWLALAAIALAGRRQSRNVA